MASLQKKPEQSQTIYARVETSALTAAWMPSSEKSGVLEVTESCAKIRKVAPLQASAQDIITRLRNSWPGRVYINNLKQYGFFRTAAQCVWRNGYPVYVNYVATHFGNRKAKRWRPLTKQSVFAKRGSVPVIKLADASIAKTSEPKVFPKCDRDFLVPPIDRYTFPEIFVAIIEDAMVYGGTNMVLADGEVVCHDLYSFEHDYTSEELHSRIRIQPRTSRIRWLMHDEDPEPIAEAATFVDACAENYAHWMTEVIPRVVLFCADERFNDVPLVVNADLHQNIMESLLMVAGADREIIVLPVGRALAVAKLHLTSVAGYVPFGRRNKKLSGHSHGVFSPQALEKLRKHLCAPGRNTEEHVWPEKIYLRRNSGTRKVTNSGELEKLLVSRGYAIVETEKLTFLQQIQLFKNAKEIVAPTGAALSNAIFCAPGTHVNILMARHEDMIYRYWGNMLNPIQISVGYVLCDIVKNRDLGIHGDFIADTGDVEKLLESQKIK